MLSFLPGELDMKKNKAFTLAEVLITLGVIGVVAAITIPGLMAKYYEKRTINQLKAAQSIISRAFRLAEEEYGEVDGWGIIKGQWSGNNATIAANYLKPFLKIAIDCGLSDNNKKCVSKNYVRLNGQKHDINYSTDRRYYKLTLLNGMSLWWKAGAEPKSIITIWVDTNGKYPPNTWGKDLFVFSYENGGLRPWGAPNSEYPYKGSCTAKNANGYGCAYYVLYTKKMDYFTH